MVVCEGGKLVERDRILAQQREQSRRHVGELHAPFDGERRGREKRRDVVDASPFLGQHAVCAQDVERVESFAFAVLDERNRKGFAFADDAHRHRVVGGDVFLREQQVERGFAATT